MKAKKQLIDFENKGNEKHHFKLRPALLSLCMLTFIGGYSQTGQVNLNLKNASVKELFREIEKQTSYHFSYRDAEVQGKTGVTVNVKNETLKSVLNRELAKYGLSYQVSGNKIIVIKVKQSAKPKGAIKQINGRVVDSKGEAVIGATVQEKGSGNNGTITDFDGNFALKVAEGASLEVSYIGFKTQQLVAVADKVMTVTLKEDTEVLDEVVVVGYGVQKKANLSGAVATVESKTIENRPVLNMGQALQGAVANLNVNVGDGEADDSPSYNIRGYTSINGGGPLVVIDGVVSTSDQLNRLNPTDIANISILKDAASSAIYGSRAAYGVILVTTRMGDKEKLTQ